VSRVGKRVQLDAFGICRPDRAAHLAGDEAVRLAVDQQDRHLRAADGFRRPGRVQVEAAEQPRRDRRADAREERGIPPAFDHAAEDLSRRGERAVRDHAAHVRWQRPARSGQHGRRAHRDADEQDRRLRAEAPQRPVDPAAQVAALFDAEGHRVPLAAALGALLDHQQVVSLAQDDLRPAAEVPRGRATPAVAADVQRRAVRAVVIPSAERQPVVRADAHALTGQRAQRVDHGDHFLAVRAQIRRHGHGVVVVLLAVGRVEHGVIGRAAHGEEKRRPGAEEPENCHRPPALRTVRRSRNSAPSRTRGTA